MPDFRGLDPVIADQEAPSTKQVYNPAPVPVNVPVGTGDTNSGNIDLDKYFGQIPDALSHEQIIPESELVANKRYQFYNPNIKDIENEARWGQSGWNRAGHAIDNFVEKTGAYIIQNAGFLLGAAPAAMGGIVNYANKFAGGEEKVINNGNAVSLMTDNFMTNIGEAWKENVQERSPIYKSDYYTKGSIWSKLATSDWWLDDAMDRLALTAAMFTPGLLEAKGLGLFGNVIREGGSIEATGLGAKAIKTIADNPEMYGKLGKVLGNAVYKSATTGVVDMTGAAALNFKNAMRLAQNTELITFNVIGQNGLNGKETQSAIRKSLIEQNEKGLSNYTPQQIDDMSAQGARESFWYNMPLTIAGSMWELPQVFASMRGGMNVLKKTLKVRSLDELYQGAITAAETVKPTIGATIGKALFTGFEHGQLESSQVAIGRYVEEAISGKIVDGHVEHRTDDPLMGSLKEYINNFSDPNGQNNIALGTIQGMLTTIFGRAYKTFNTDKSGKNTFQQQDEANKNFLTHINEAIAGRRQFNAMSDMTQKNDDGTVKFEDGKVLWNQDKLAQLGVSYIDQVKNFEDRLEALGTGDQTAIDKMSFDSLKSLADNFFQDSNGKEYLINVLNFEAKQQRENPDRQNDVIGSEEITPEHKLQESLQYVESLYKIKNAIDQRHAGFLNLNIDYKNKDEVNLAAQYTEALKTVQYNMGADQLFYNAKLQKNAIELGSLGISEKIEVPTNPDEQRANDIIDENEFLNNYLNTAKAIYKASIDRETVNNAWEQKKEEDKRNRANAQAIVDEANKPTVDQEGNPIPPKTVTITTKTGENEIEIGTEYMLGKIVEHDKNGNEVFRAPTLTVLGENEDGTIKIKASNGTIKDVSKEEFEDYKLSKVSDVMKDKKAKFFYDNWNTQFEHFGIKINGKPAIGRLEYSPKEGILVFKYKDSKEKLQTREVTGKLFLTKKGYNHPMIRSIGTLTAEQMKSQEEYANAKDERSIIQRANRLKVLSDLYNTIDTRRISVNNLIEQKQTEIENIKKELGRLSTVIENGEVDSRINKGFNFKANVRDALHNTRRLSRMQQQFEDELADLQDQKDEIEFNISYIEDAAQNIDELPIDTHDFLDELKSHVDMLKDASVETAKEMSALAKVRDSISNAIDSAIDILSDYINEFKTKYPKTPLAILGQNWIEFLKANPNFLKLKPNYKSDLKSLEDLIATTEDFEIIPNKEKLIELDSKLDDLQSSMKDLEREIEATSVIYNKFKAIYDQYAQQKAEERQMQKNEALKNEIIGTLDKSVQNDYSNTPYEAASKKTVSQIPNSTTTNDGTPHQARLDKFGKAWSIMDEDNRRKFKWVDVTLNTQNQILPELIQHVLPNPTEKYSQEEVIVAVVVLSNADGTISLIDETGKIITERNEKGELNNALNMAIYQTRPLHTLMAKYDGIRQTMFRDGTPDEVQQSIREQYEAQRNQILKQNTLQSGRPFSVSFGSPQYVMIDTGKIDPAGNSILEIDKNARVSATDAKLIPEKLLTQDQVITVATTNDNITEGSVTFRKALGRVFLRIPGIGMAKLFNRKLNDTEANIVFDVMLQLTKNAVMDGTIKSEKSERLFKWLRSTIYWGFARDFTTNKRKSPGYSNVWFEDVSDEESGEVIPKLFISGLKTDSRYDFTPTGLTNAKAEIIILLKEIYRNTNATMVSEKQYLNPYYDITGIDKNGEPITKEWANYQTFLLANKTPDGKIRTGEEIPLTTRFKPLTNTEDTNRKDMYLTLDESVDDFIRAKKVQTAPVQKAPAKPVTETPEAPTVNKTSTKKFVLDGVTPNFMKLGPYGVIEFTLNGKKQNSDDPAGAINFNSKDDVVLAIMVGMNKPQMEAVQIVANSIVTNLETQLAEMKLPETPPPVDSLPENPTEPAPEETNNNEDDFDTPTDKIDKTVYRAKLANSINSITENWTNVEKTIKTELPNISLYRVKNAIFNGNGQQLWGMLQDGGIYIDEHAEGGTIFHEIFEAVWKSLADPKEKIAIAKEFRNRKGGYTDRFGKGFIEYKNATDREMKEELAEQYRDFRYFDIEPDRSEGKSFISKLFHDVWDFIKFFFTGEHAISNTQKLFNNIKKGYYAKYNPYQSQLSYAKTGVIDVNDAFAGVEAEARIKNIPALQLRDILQHMTYLTLTNYTRNNENLFTISKPKPNLYKELNTEILNLIKYQKELQLKNLAEGKIVSNKNETAEEKVAREVANIKHLYTTVKSQWNNIVTTHKDYLKSYNITFDENDNMVLEDEDNSGKEDYQDARKIDSFRKANSAIKLLFATLPYTNADGTWVDSTIGGVKTLPADQVNITLLNKLHSSITIDQMINNLNDFVLGNPNYIALYKRITGKSPATDQKADFNNMKDYDLLLLNAFWQAMKKQSADILALDILPTGETQVIDSAANRDSKQATRDLSSSIVNTIRKNENQDGKKLEYFDYDKKTGKYKASAKLKAVKLSSNNLETYTDFLNNLGIEFNIRDIESLKNYKAGYYLKIFRSATEGILESLSKIGEIARDKSGKIITNSYNKSLTTEITTLSTKTLNIGKRINQLGIIRAILENPDLESTFFNLNGERTQTYIGTNALSNFYDTINQLKNLNDLETNSLYSAFKFLLTDKFTVGSSIMLNKMFNLSDTGTGDRIPNTDELMHSVFVDGTIDQQSGKKTESSSLKYRQRILQELNMNTAGVYMNLVPGDASIEHAVTMHSEDNPFITEEAFLNKKYLEVFRDYFKAEVELSRDNRNVVEGKTATDLRFFKDILGKELHDKIVKKANKKIPADELYKAYEKEINNKVIDFIENESKEYRSLLERYNIINYTADEIETSNISMFEEIENLTSDIIDTKLKVSSVNYMIANIELHKLIYSDPYQYTDELKRTKSFDSPRQPLILGSSLFNTAYEREFNEGYTKKDIGRTDFMRNHFRAATFNDIWTNDSELKDYMKPFEETDGAGIILLKANRVLGLKSGEWTSDNERQRRYDVAYEKFVKGEGLSNTERANKGLLMSPEELAFEIKKVKNDDGTFSYKGKNPNIKSTYTPKKPIVTGSKDNGRSYNDIVLHKFALVPLSFRIIHELNPESNLLKLYNKMQNEDVDYGVYKSGSKVGTELTTELYNPNGSFNESPFVTQEQLDNPDGKQTIINIPYSIISIQSEVPSKDKPEVTQGSQITKLVTMDFLEAGMPITFDSTNKDFNNRYAKWVALSKEEKLKNDLYKKIHENRILLIEKIKDGYDRLLKRLGIEEIKATNEEVKGYKINNKSKLVKTLKDEILKRDVNYNITEAFKGFESGDVVLEATPSYQQIRNILFSIADKNVVRPKINGGLKVQIPSSLLESIRAEVKMVNDKPVYSSKDLKFYRNKDGERVCEIMVARWFNSNMSDKQLLDYLNNTDEGKKILGGVGFRIPTQKQNSIDVFKIAKFLPKDFGDSVVIPSQLVRKVGSDFDIDKLSIYLKNIYRDGKGNIKLVPFLGFGEQAKAKFGDMYDRGEFLSKDQYKQLQEYVGLEGSPEDILMKSIFGELADFTEEETTKEFLESIATEGERQVIIDKMYTKSIENQYISSLEGIISDPSNFDNLIKPNSADQLKNLTKKINKAKNITEIDYSLPGNMLSRSFMSNLRQSFVSGKYAIGIAAVGQTNNAQNQQILLFPDIDKLKKDILDPIDEKWIDDGKINFEYYNSVMVNGKSRSTLSMVQDANPDVKLRNNISDVIGQFIDGYVDISKGPWIMELGITPNVTGTWLFLIKMGVPIDTVAFFMNQPILTEYLRSIENAGYSWLFMDAFVNDMLDKYKGSEDVVINKIPSEDDLFKMVGKDNTTLNDLQNAQQRYILNEFLKYAMIANHLFRVTQGSNFDTANINDSFLIFQKQRQLEKARNTIFSSVGEDGSTIIPGVDDLLNNTFVGFLKNKLFDIRDSFTTILISDRPNSRYVMEKVLDPYVEMNPKDFVKIAQKAVADMFDWTMQNTTKVNINIASILLGNKSKKSAAQEIIEYRDKVLSDETHPLYNNIILHSIDIKPGDRDGQVDNLYIKGRDTKAYDQNLIIYGFEEIKNVLRTENRYLYGRLVRLAVLQSGLTTSPISFTSLLPYEDFVDVYNEALSSLEKMDNLENFHTLHVFERNNWNNINIMPIVRAKMVNWENYRGFTEWDDANTFLDKKLQSAVKTGKVPKVIGLNKLSQNGRHDFIVYTWEDKISKKERILQRKNGNRDYIHKVLMQKIYTSDINGKPTPLIYSNKDKKTGRIYEKYLYKAINAWGDSFKAQEFYDKLDADPLSTVAQASVLNNGFDKVEQQFNEEGDQIKSAEVENIVIDDLLNNRTPEQRNIENVESEVIESRLTPQEMKELLNKEKTNNWEQEDNNCIIPI